MKKFHQTKEAVVHNIPDIPARFAHKFAGKTAAVVHGKVVAAGRNTQEALRNALKKFPKMKEWEIGIMSIPPRDGVWII